VREQAAAIAREAGIAIEHIAKRHIRASRPSISPLSSATDTSRVCVILGSFGASAEPIATTSPASAAPPSQPAATSPKTFSFPLSH